MLQFVLGGILLIGDSHSVMSFGQELATQLGAQRYAVSGSAASDWSRPLICAPGEECTLTYGYATPSGVGDILPLDFQGLAPRLQTMNPRAVVIALGTNDADQRCHKRDMMKTVRRLLSQVGARECFWVGPPEYKDGPLFDQCGADYDRFVNRLRATVRAHHCIYIDSRKILDPSTGRPIASDENDKIHFSETLGPIWAAAVGKRIKTRLSNDHSFSSN